MRRVTIIGAGRTGRGMLGELFWSEGDVELVFADCDAELVEGLRAQGWYRVEQLDLLSGASSITRVDSFQMVDTLREHERYLDYLETSELIATAVFPESFDRVARDLAEMVALRAARGHEEPVAVILGGNFVGLTSYFKDAIARCLTWRERDVFERDVTLLTSKANRKVVRADSGEPYELIADDKAVLPIDDAFPFGPDWNMPTFFEPVPSCELSMIEKIWNENLLHCSLGFMGAYSGYETINEAVADDGIRTLARLAWLEGRQALQAEYGMPMPTAEEERVTFEKFSSPHFADKIARIVRQPIRKLQKNDRFLGPALLCLKHEIVPYFILHAAAFGFCYVDEREPQSVEIAQAIAAHGIRGAIDQVCALHEDDPDERMVEAMLLASIQEIRASGRMSHRHAA